MYATLLLNRSSYMTEVGFSAELLQCNCHTCFSNLLYKQVFWQVYLTRIAALCCNVSIGLITFNNVGRVTVVVAVCIPRGTSTE